MARLALISGMFHRWEKVLREYLTSHDSIGAFPDRSKLLEKVRQSNFEEVLKLFKGAGLFQRGCPIREKLNICRMVVNSYKHAPGPSERVLRSQHPELFTPTAKGLELDGLYVENKHIGEFSAAIEDFWKSVPESIVINDIQSVPKWFAEAYKKDELAHKRQTPPKWIKDLSTD